MMPRERFKEALTFGKPDKVPLLKSPPWRPGATRAFWIGITTRCF